jgi:hypothetical protein
VHRIISIVSDMLVVTASPAPTALKISQLTGNGMPPAYDSMPYCTAGATTCKHGLRD